MGENLIRRRALVVVDYDPVLWRKEHGDEGLDYERVVEDVSYAWDLTELSDIVANGPASIARCASVSVDYQMGPRNREDEAGFRRGAPRCVGALEIVAVHGYTPGSLEQGYYAWAIALTRSVGAVQEWSTHTLYHQDDRPDHEWLLNGGAYVDSEIEARTDLIERAR